MKVETTTPNPTISEVVDLFSSHFPGLNPAVVARACVNRGVELRDGRLCSSRELRTVYFGITELAVLTPSQIDARNKERGTYDWFGLSGPTPI